MKEINKIIYREWRKIFADKNLIMIFIIAPLLYPVIYGAVYMDKTEENLPIAVEDFDNSSLSRSLIRDIDAHQNIAVSFTSHDDSLAKAQFLEDKIKAILFIPQNFSRDVKFGKKVELKLFISPGRIIVMGDVDTPISQFVSTFGGKVTAAALMKKGVPVMQNKGYAVPINITTNNLYNPYLTYGDLMLPGLLIIILSQLVLIGVAASQAKENALGKGRKQFIFTENTFKIAFGKLFFYVLIFMIFSISYYLIISPFYKIHFNSTFLNYFIITLLGIMSSAACGLFLGTFFRHKIVAFLVLGFSTYPFFLITGYAWPQEQLPYFLQIASNALPHTPFLKSVMIVTQMQNNLMAASWYLILLILQVFCYGILFMLQLKRKKLEINII